MATVYRMENASGHGPFSAGGANGSRETMENMWRNVPWIETYGDGLAAKDEIHPHHLKDVLKYDDNKTYIADLLGVKPLEGNWTVGVKDMQQFFHWFPPQSLADFEKEGMRLDAYDVPVSAIRYGDYQLLFDPTKAKLIKSHPLSELVPNPMPMAA